MSFELPKWIQVGIPIKYDGRSFGKIIEIKNVPHLFSSYVYSQNDTKGMLVKLTSINISKCEIDFPSWVRIDQKVINCSKDDHSSGFIGKITKIPSNIYKQKAFTSLLEENDGKVLYDIVNHTHYVGAVYLLQNFLPYKKICSICKKK